MNPEDPELERVSFQGIPRLEKFHVEGRVTMSNRMSFSVIVHVGNTVDTSTSL